MKWKNLSAAVVAAAVLAGVVPSSPALAQADDRFSALQGIEAQALSVDEMQAIAGELNAYDIAAALYAKAATLNAFPTLKALVTKLADYYLANAAAINALFAKYGILTPCTSSLCPP